VDTYKCVHMGHHLRLLTLCTDGRNWTLTEIGKVEASTHTEGNGAASRQYGDVGQFAIEIYLPVRATNKDENRGRLCFSKLASLNPI